MKYTKMGAIFQPKGNYEWMHYYSCPLSALELEDRIRIYFTTRSKIDDEGNFRTYITFLECDKRDPSKVLYIHNKPLLQMGLPGTFDEHGTMISKVVLHNGKYYMYYIGWQRSDTVPYLNSIGLAMSDDGINFTRVSDGPVMGFSRFNPYGVGNGGIVIEDGVFHFWYNHINPWIKTEFGFRPTYETRHAYSHNGLDWHFDDKLCIVPSHPNETIASACMRNIDGRYHMWYSYRLGVDSKGNSGKYLIGYAISENKMDWERRDSEVNITVSENGWDSEMMLCPEVLKTSEDMFMFYCGNQYGRDGFGYAKIENF